MQYPTVSRQLHWWVVDIYRFSHCTGIGRFRTLPSSFISGYCFFIIFLCKLPGMYTQALSLCFSLILKRSTESHILISQHLNIHSIFMEIGLYICSMKYTYTKGKISHKILVLLKVWTPSGVVRKESGIHSNLKDNIIKDNLLRILIWRGT